MANWITKLRKIGRKGKKSTGAEIASNIKKISPTDLHGIFPESAFTVSNKRVKYFNTDFESFQRATRRGDLRNSFMAANPNIVNAKTRATLEKSMLEARKALPDYDLQKKALYNSDISKKFDLPKNQLKTANDLEQYSLRNKQFRQYSENVLNKGKKSKLRRFGKPALIIGAGVTLAGFYDAAVKEAANSSGLFAYRGSGDSAQSCKINTVSCKYPQTDKNNEPSEDFWTLIGNTYRENKDCTNSPNEVCIHDDDDETDDKSLRYVFEDIDDSITLVCEVVTPSDVIFEWGRNVAEIVGGGVSSVLWTLLKPFLIIAAAIAGIIALFKFTPTLLRSGSGSSGSSGSGKSTTNDNSLTTETSSGDLDTLTRQVKQLALQQQLQQIRTQQAQLAAI